MTIPTPPSFSSVRTEFNNAGMGLASNLFAYRRGGGIVPNINYYNAIGLGTAESPLRLSQFAGLEGSAIATLTNHSGQVDHNVFAFQGQASTFTRLTVNTTGAYPGQLTILGSTGYSAFYFAQGSIIIDSQQYWSDNSESGSTSGEVNVQNWLIGGGASAYSCRATIQSETNSGQGTFRYGTYGSWISLASQGPEFAVQTEAVDTYPATFRTLVFLLEFARTDNLSNILGSCTITLSGASDFSNDNPSPEP